LATSEHEKSIALGKLAAQAAHDIRAPLTALNMITTSKNINALPADERKLIFSAVNRIQDISEDLLEQNRAIRSSSDEKQFDIVVALHEPIEEKLIVFEGTEINLHANISAYYTKGNKADFQRAIRNILN